MSLRKDGLHGPGGRSMYSDTASATFYPDFNDTDGITTTAASSDFAPGKRASGCIDRITATLAAATGVLTISNHAGNRNFLVLTNAGGAADVTITAELGVAVTSEDNGSFSGGFRVSTTNAEFSLGYRTWRSGARVNTATGLESPIEFGPEAD